MSDEKFWQRAWPDTWPEFIVYGVILIIVLNLLDEAFGTQLNDTVWTQVKDIGSWAVEVFREVKGS